MKKINLKKQHKGKQNQEANSPVCTTQKRYKWSCGACGGSDDTGCLSSTGECYR